ncbi:MAG: N-acetylmuramoyl-L-alanine amidase [Acidobacteriales bacterium]|nr:N-acetylmuramoyl-L-alanine amidase [Terriglobales bacterium]
MRRAFASGLLLLAALALLHHSRPVPVLAAGEKRLSVYAPSANYTLPVFDYKGQEYVGLFEILEPLGAVQAKTSGSRWKLRFNQANAEFEAGKTTGKINGKEAVLNGVFLLQNNRGLVPVSSLAALLPYFLTLPIDFHESSRRLFLAGAGTTFTTQLSGTPPALVFSFSAPVAPAITAGNGELRLSFNRDPLRAPSRANMTFPDPAIPSAIYQEENGIAEILVHGTSPLQARVSGDARSITITAPAAVVTQPPPAPPPTAATGPALSPPPSVSLPAPRQYFAVVDAAHGGDDPGTLFSPQLAEKNITLALARRIRQELENRGLATLMVRDGDYALTPDQRANLANASHATVYIAVHASPQAHGLRVYRGLVPALAQSTGPFLDWNTAQSSFVESSAAAAQAITLEANNQKFPARALIAPVRPLNNIITAAVAIEAAPLGDDPAELTSRAYQQRVATIVAGAIANTKNRLEVRP